MIHEAVISSGQNGELTVREHRRSILDHLVETVGGLILIGAGCLTMYVLLFGFYGPPIPDIIRRILGWILVAFIFCVMGILPCVLGLNGIFLRRSCTLYPVNAVVEAHLHFAGVRFWTRRLLFSAFERITIRREDFGRFARFYKYVVACEGKRRLDIAVFESPKAAAALAGNISTCTRLPIEDLSANK